MTLQETFDSFLLSKRLADLSPKTISAYHDFVLPFIASVGGDKAFVTVSQTDIVTYLQTLLNKPISKASKATYIRHIKIYLKWCDSEYGASYVTDKIKVPRSPKKQVRIYTDNEVKQIFSSIYAESDWMALRNKCMIALMFDSGLRQSEVCGLQLKKLSLSDNRAIVCGKGDKERVIPLGQLAQIYLNEYLQLCPYQSGNVFVGRYGGQLSCNAVKLMISKLADALPFEFSSHRLRHNFATNYCINQYDKYGQIDIYRLMYLMGHEDVDTTRRYLHFAYEVIASRGCISQLDKTMDVGG